MRIAAPLCLCALLAGAISAAQLTGSYNLGPGNDGNQATQNMNGTFHLTATNSTFSYVDFVPNQMVTFGQLTVLNSIFTSNAGGSGGGSPRLSVGLNDNGTEKNLHIFFGNSPNFTDTNAVLNTWSGVNLIGNNDAGRYDTSQFNGGSPFTTYAAALALLGSLPVEEIFMVEDTFGDFPSRDLTLNSINGAFNSATPEPGTFALLGAGLLAAGVFLRRR